MEFLHSLHGIMAAVVDLAPLPTPSSDEARLKLFLTLFFTVAGAIALLVVTVGGFKYVTSHGDPSGTAQAKNTILYALIGLVVCIIGASIVNFVVGRVT